MADPVVAGLQAALEEILSLQEHWEPGGVNNAAMERRGVLVRSTVPDLLRSFLDRSSLPRELAAEGSDGAGRKARVPWARVYSPALSPRASDGWYLVYLFSADGKWVYLSLNQGTTDATAGYRERAEFFLRERVEWARSHVDRLALPSSSIDLGEGTPLARAYEAGHVAGTAYARDSVPGDDQLGADLEALLGGLETIYAAELELKKLPVGYAPGEALYGFTLPTPFTSEGVAGMPDEPGVHVVWAHEGELLFAGLSRRLRERARQHFHGDRTGSILREKVGRRLEQELGKEPTAEQITTFLRTCTIAWRVVTDPDRLKARIMDELRPVFNDVRPRLDLPEAKVLAVYVGQRAEANLHVGLGARTWGFSEERHDHAAVGVGDWLVLASRFTGGSPRTSAAEWAAHGVARLVLGRITTPLYTSADPLWPDEKLGEARYPYRLEFEIVDNVADVGFAAGLIGPDVAEAIRLSALGRGLGHLAPADGSLFGTSSTVTTPAARKGDPAEFSRVCLDFSARLADANLEFGGSHDSFVRTFVTSLATKRLVLLTGLSGSGKTRIALGFGQWLGDHHYAVIPVRPDWTGPEPLLGYEDALLPAKGSRRAWNVPEPLRFMLRAAHDPGSPYLLVLDEMNLAHVERYFADLLSGIESDEPVLPNLMLDEGYWRIPADADERIPVPTNLFIAGTVNVDETTYLFSPKVLDRANTIEFRVASDDLRTDALPPRRVEPGDPSLAAAFLALASDVQWQAKHPASNRELVADKLTELHRVLSEFGFEFGHRVFFEALRFASLLEASGETSQWAGLDLQVLQKVLPRLHGSARRLTEPLSAVAQFAKSLKCERVGGTYIFDHDTVSEGADVGLPLSYDKARRMLRSLRVNQFASFSE